MHVKEEFMGKAIHDDINIDRPINRRLEVKVKVFICKLSVHFTRSINFRMKYFEIKLISKKVYLILKVFVHIMLNSFAVFRYVIPLSEALEMLFVIRLLSKTCTTLYLSITDLFKFRGYIHVKISKCKAFETTSVSLPLL